MGNTVDYKSYCHSCEYFHENDPDYPDNCEYPDNPPCNTEQHETDMR